MSIAIIAVVGGCAGVRTDREIAYERANNYLTQHPATNARIAEVIRELDLQKGMAQAQVRLAERWPRMASVEKCQRLQGLIARITLNPERLEIGIRTVDLGDILRRGEEIGCPFY